MDTKIKNYMGWAGIVLMAALALSALWFVRAYSKVSEPSSFRSFSASGEGKVVAIPDVAQFTFSVVTQGGADLGASQKDNTAKVNKAIGVIKAAGVADKDIKTEQYSVEPRYEYCQPNVYGAPTSGTTQCPPPKIVGYTVQQSVSVKARDFSKVGGMLADVVQSGANSVSQLSFVLDDPTAVQNQARAEAIQKAKAKAESIASAGGFSLGKLLSISEGGTAPVPMYSLGFGGAKMESSMAPSPVIQAGSQDVIVDVTLSYEIAD